jgi:transcriptional regulator with XRE-family HTH domain
VKLNYEYNKLRGRIIEKYGTQENFAEAVGLSTNSISRKMNGKAGFSQEDIERWSEKLEIKQEEYGKYFFA